MIESRRQYEGSFTDLATVVATELSHIWDARNTAVSNRAWEAASYFAAAYHSLVAAWEAEQGKTLAAHKHVKQIHDTICRAPGYTGPKGTWLSDAKKTLDFTARHSLAGQKMGLPYDTYRFAVCSRMTDEE